MFTKFLQKPFFFLLKFTQLFVILLQPTSVPSRMCFPFHLNVIQRMMVNKPTIFLTSTPPSERRRIVCVETCQNLCANAPTHPHHPHSHCHHTPTYTHTPQLYMFLNLCSHSLFLSKLFGSIERCRNVVYDLLIIHPCIDPFHFSFLDHSLLSP